MSQQDALVEQGGAVPGIARQNRKKETAKVFQQNKGILLIGLIILVLIGVVILGKAGLHHVQEGFVAVYYRGGALLNEIADPGYHWMIPILTTYKQIQVTIQTDSITNVPCGTAGGVIIHFDRIEVVNLLKRESVYNIVKNYSPDYDRPLIHNKIHHEINQFCSKNTIQEVYIDKFDTIDENLKHALQIDLEKMAPGLSVQSVRVTKPTIPEAISKNYERMEAEKTELLVASQHQKVVEKMAETDRKKAIIEAEKNHSVAVIKFNQTIAEKEMEKTVNRLQDEIHLARQKATADAEFYKSAKEAEANSQLLTDKYLEMKRIEAVRENNKIFYGNSIPSAFFADISQKAGLEQKKTK